MISTASDGSAKLIQKLKPYVYIVLLQFGFAGMYVISAATLKSGMNHFVLVVYRNLVGVVIIAPFALIFERKKRPKITPQIFLKIVALAVLEPVLDQNCYYMGNKLTNASFSAAFMNILPAVTFILAIILRMEKINISRRRSQAKLIGTTIMLVGAILMILYNGPILKFFWSKEHHNTVPVTGQDVATNWLKGTFMLFLSCISWSMFFIVQANTLESYPAELTLTTLICAIGALLSAVVAIMAEHGNTKTWKIGLDMKLFTAVYSGIVCSGIAYYVQGIVMQERGPVFVTAFNPLCMILTALMGSIILAEEISLGRVIGATIIVIGLYSLIWGKSEDYLVSSSKKEAKNGVTELPMIMTTINGTRVGLVEGNSNIEIPTIKNP